MDEPLYFIYWKSTVTGARGCGTKSFPREQAQSICDSLNKQDKEFHIVHWIDIHPPEPRTAA